MFVIQERIFPLDQAMFEAGAILQHGIPFEEHDDAEVNRRPRWGAVPEPLRARDSRPTF